MLTHPTLPPPATRLVSRTMILRLLAALLVLAPAVAAAREPASTAGVVSAADPRAAEAGAAMLRRGGSATDAALATLLALGVVEPQSSGIGGGGFLVHSDPDGTVTSIDGRETAPFAADPARFLGPDGQPRPFGEVVPGGLSVGVPGNVALMKLAHDRWGTLPWAALFEPAIALARDGFTVNATLEQRLASVADRWGPFPAARALYWRDGAPKRAGDRVVNPALAALLTRIATEGPDAFYRGANAAAIVAAVRAAPNPSDMTVADLAAYRAIERPAPCRLYREYRVCVMGPPSSGATTVLEMLGLLERFDLAALGPASPVAWHLIGQAMRLSYADRARYVGDPGFTYVPVPGLLSPGYLAERSRAISAERSLGTYPPGTPPGALPRVAATPGEKGGTSHFVATDADGSVVSMTSTVEGVFGSQLVVNGMVLNNELTDFSFAPVEDGERVANRVQGGKRPMSSMSPAIVFDASGRAVFTVGAAGGPTIITQVAKALIAWIDWDMTAQQAIAVPNLFFRGDSLVVEGGTALAELAPQIAALGTPVVASDQLGGKANAAERTDAGWVGAADPRSEGAAVAP